MKYLNNFLSFNWNEFAEGKSFMVIGISDYQDFDSKAHIGSKVDCVIVTDNTKYKRKDGDNATNRFEKISFKVSKDVNIPIESRVIPVNAVATIYGE